MRYTRDPSVLSEILNLYRDWAFGAGVQLTVGASLTPDLITTKPIIPTTEIVAAIIDLSGNIEREIDHPTKKRRRSGVAPWIRPQSVSAGRIGLTRRLLTEPCSESAPHRVDRASRSGLVDADEIRSIGSRGRARRRDRRGGSATSR